MKNEKSANEQLHSELELLIQIMDVGGHLAIEMHSRGSISYDEWVQEVRKRIQLPVEVGRWGRKSEKRNQQLPLFPDKLD